MLLGIPTCTTQPPHKLICQHFPKPIHQVNHLPCSCWPCQDCWGPVLTSHPSFHLGSTAMQSCCLMSSRRSGRENSTGIWISLLIWVDWNGIGYISIYCSKRFICLTDAWVLEQETASKESVQLPHFAVWETGVSRANIPSIIKNLSTRALPRIPGSWPLIPQLHIVRKKKIMSHLPTAERVGRPLILFWGQKHPELEDVDGREGLKKAKNKRR